MMLQNLGMLWWAALAIPIIVFYILKIRLRRVPVSTILFWRQIFEEKQPRSIWQHLRHLLSLLLQLFFLSLLVFALTEPYFKWEILEARQIVLVVDNSAGMRATDVLPTRLDAAKAEAKRLIERLRLRDELALVAAGTQAHVVCGFTHHERTLQEMLDSIAATDGPTRVADGVELARRLLGGKKNGQVIVVTDGCFDGAEKLAEAKDVQLIAVGKNAGNVGITRFQVRRSLLDPIGYQILVEVRNQSDERVDCRLEIDLNDEAVDVVPLQLEANGEWSRTIDKASAEGGRLVAKLNRDDALLADNTAWALLPKREMQRVTLVTEGNLFLQKVFEANPLVKLTVVDSSESTGAVSEEASPLTVFHREVPVVLPRGGVFVIDPAGSSDLWELGDKLTNPIVAKQDKDSLLMAHVRLDNVLMPEAHLLSLKGKPQVLASSINGEPLLCAWDRPEGKVLLLTVNLNQGDLPLRTAFPILATNALGWFAGSSGELREALATGTVTEVELSRDSAAKDKLELRSPAGNLSPLALQGTKTTIGPLDQCGIWSVVPATATAGGSTEGKVSTSFTEIACNLSNREESDLRVPKLLQEKALAESHVAGFGTRPLWYYLIALAWLFAGVEWYLYQRRWIS